MCVCVCVCGGGVRVSGVLGHVSIQISHNVEWKILCVCVCLCVSVCV